MQGDSQGDSQGETFGGGAGQEPHLPPAGVPDGPAHMAGAPDASGAEPRLETGSVSFAPDGKVRDADTLPPTPPPAPPAAPVAGQHAAPPYSPQYAQPPYDVPHYAGFVPAQTPQRPPPAPSRPPVPTGPTQRHGIPWYAWVVGAVAGVLVLAVVGCCGVSGLAFGLLGHLHVSPEQTETTTRTFAVSGMPELALHNPAGNVTITPGDSGKVVVQATKRVREGFGGNASADLNAINVQMTQSGNAVTVLVQFPSGSNFTDRTADLDITTPASSNVTLTDNAGNVTLGAISGQVAITNNAGNVTATGTTLSGHSRISENAGNVKLDGAVASGATLSITVNAGNVTLHVPANTPAHLSAETSVGNVSVTGWPIGVTRTGAGAHASGNLAPNPTATITVTVSAGNATIEAK